MDIIQCNKCRVRKTINQFNIREREEGEIERPSQYPYREGTCNKCKKDILCTYCFVYLKGHAIFVIDSGRGKGDMICRSCSEKQGIPWIRLIKLSEVD